MDFQICPFEESTWMADSWNNGAETIFGLKIENVRGYSQGIMERFIICTLHKMEACSYDQIKMIEMAGARSTQGTEE